MGNWLRLAFLAVGLTAVFQLHAADNLKLNPHLDYNSDSQDGPLITGDRLDEGTVPGVPNYVIIYGEGCYNSKRQARRTVELYRQYRGRVHFVIVDIDQARSASQEELKNKYYGVSIPHVVILDGAGSANYNSDSEVASEELSRIFDQLLAKR